MLLSNRQLRVAANKYKNGGADKRSILMSNHVTTLKNGRVVEVLLNRPSVNAIDFKTSCELFDAFKRLF